MPTKLIIRKQKIRGRLFLEKLSEGIDLKMVVIPAGTYVMGTPEEEIERLCKEYSVDYFKRERPQHLVSVPSFCMGQTQVTQAQWREVASWEKVDIDLNPEPSGFKGEKRPVEQVSWEEAQEFCARLSQRTGREYGLPSEAEWEYACRGELLPSNPALEEGKEIEEWNEKYLKPFHYGETITTDLVNYNGNYSYGKGKKGKYRKETTDVGSFPANRWGLYDMHGNVWEWCEDDYHGNYEGAPRDGRAWVNPEDDNTTKILRGGSWFNYPWYCRSADRHSYSRGYRNSGLGFRVACSLLGSP